MRSGGGTLIHCPFCNKITPCKSLPQPDGHRFILTDSGLDVFRRERECQECKEIFVTFELSLQYFIKACKEQEREKLKLKLKDLREAVNKCLDEVDKSLIKLQETYHDTE